MLIVFGLIGLFIFLWLVFRILMKRTSKRVLPAMLMIAPLMFMLTAAAPMQEGGTFVDFDWAAISENFLSASVFGIPIILLVIGLVYALGEKFDVHGKAQFAISMGLGLIFGGGYQAGVGSLGYGFLAIFSYVVYGLLMGWFATFLYDTAKDLLTKVTEKMLGFKDQGQG